MSVPYPLSLCTVYCLYHVSLSPWLRLGSRHNNIVIAGNNNCFDEEPTRTKRTKNLQGQRDERTTDLFLQFVEFEPQVSLNSFACSSTLLVVLDLEFNRQLIFRQCSKSVIDFEIGSIVQHPKE